MGVRNYLIEGLSGAGKTTAAEELQRRGHHVIHGDRTLAYVSDAQTDAALPAPEGVSDRVWRGYVRWIWNVDEVRALAADRRHPQTFFCGGSRNLHHFIDMFDAVFVLEADLDTLKRRVAARGDDEFGGKPEEWALIARLHATQAAVPKNATRIDATAPVARVVDEILLRCGAAQR